MKLYLVQHGEASAKTVDPERPLTELGRTDVEQLARFLGEAGVRIERVMHSGKLRAVQTAECLAAGIRSWSDICRSWAGWSRIWSLAMRSRTSWPTSRAVSSVWNTSLLWAGRSTGC